MEKIKRVIMENARPGYEVEVYAERIKRTLIETSEEKLENLSQSEELGVGIRVLRDYRVGFAYTTDLSKESLKSCLERAYEACDMLPPDEANSFYHGDLKGNITELFDEEGLKVSLEEKIELTLSLERRAKELDRRIKGVRKASLKENVIEVYHFNTLGLEYSHLTTAYVSMMSAVAQDGHDSAISYGYRGSRKLSTLDLDGMIEDVVFKAVSQLNPEPFQTCEIPVVLYREASAMLLETFSSMFLGDALVKGKTLLKDKVGERIASEKLQIVDDGRLPEGFMYSSVDADGLRTKKNIVVENGVFKGFLHSLYTAKKTYQEPTGNSVRSGFRSLPTSGITNLYIQGGGLKLEELLSYYDEVFLVLDLMGLHTADPVSGEFSLGASGVIYKRGEKSKTVRGAVIGGDILSLWGNIVDVGDDVCFYGNVGSPSILVRSMVVGG